MDDIRLITEGKEFLISEFVESDFYESVDEAISRVEKS